MQGHGLLPAWTRGVIYPLLVVWALYSIGQQLLLAGSTNGFDLGHCLVPLAEIHAGGPPRDGIPALDRPRFVAAGEAAYLKDDDRVLGLSRHGIDKAYPIRILNYHEIVNDRFGNDGVVVSYCPLCGTGMAFLADVDGETHQFGVSGLLFNSDVLLYDRETESLWSQIGKQAVCGLLASKQLRQLVLVQTRWDVWRRQHPATRVLSLDTGYDRDYTQSPYTGYDSSDALYFPVRHLDPRYHPKEQVIGLELGGVYKAYPFAELSRLSTSSLQDRLAGQSIEVRFDAANRLGRVFDAQGSELAVTISYWFAWLAFHPDTEVFKVLPD